MGQCVFVNYRGVDSHAYGALLYTDLVHRFGEAAVFLDAESIAAGADYVAEVLARVRSARVLLAVIGPGWLAATGGRRAIDDDTDWIRRELAAAFDAGVLVIPVLTDDADLPATADLPADIRALSRCQARRLRRREPSRDLAQLAADLVAHCPELATPSATAPREEPRAATLTRSRPPATAGSPPSRSRSGGTSAAPAGGPAVATPTSSGGAADDAPITAAVPLARRTWRDLIPVFFDPTSTPEHRELTAAIAAAERAWADAGHRVLGVARNRLRSVRRYRHEARRLASATGEDGWLALGADLAALRQVAAKIEPTMATTGSPGDKGRRPTPEGAASYVAAADRTRARIRSLLAR